MVATTKEDRLWGLRPRLTTPGRPHRAPQPHLHLPAGGRGQRCQRKPSLLSAHSRPRSLCPRHAALRSALLTPPPDVSVLQTLAKGGRTEGSGGKEGLERRGRHTTPAGRCSTWGTPTSPDTGWGSCTREKRCLFPTHPVSHLRHTGPVGGDGKTLPQDRARSRWWNAGTHLEGQEAAPTLFGHNSGQPERRGRAVCAPGQTQDWEVG